MHHVFLLFACKIQQIYLPILPNDYAIWIHILIARITTTSVKVIQISNNLPSPFIKLFFCNVRMIFQPYDQRFSLHNIRTHITFVTMHYKFQNLIVPFFFQFPISFLILHKFIIMLTRFVCYVNIYFHLFYFEKK